MEYGAPVGRCLYILNIIEDLLSCCCTITEEWQVQKVQIYKNVIYRAAFD
jgi:hypothetical protein